MKVSGLGLGEVRHVEAILVAKLIKAFSSPQLVFEVHVLLEPERKLLALEGNERDARICVLLFRFFVFYFSLQLVYFFRVICRCIDELCTATEALLFLNLHSFIHLITIFITFLVGQACRFVLGDVVGELLVPALAIMQIGHHRYAHNLLLIFNILVPEHFLEHLGQKIVHPLVGEVLG